MLTPKNKYHPLRNGCWYQRSCFYQGQSRTNKINSFYYVTAGSSTKQYCASLTIVIDAVYESHSHLGMVVSHQDNIKSFFIIRVQLKKPGIDMHQRLGV